MLATAKRKGTIKAKVYRAKTGKWHDLGVIASTSWFWNFKKRITNYIKKLI